MPERSAGLEEHLDQPLDAHATVGSVGEQQVLGLDPAHRAGELPGQQLDEHETAELTLTTDPGVAISKDAQAGEMISPVSAGGRSLGSRSRACRGCSR